MKGHSHVRTCTKKALKLQVTSTLAYDQQMNVQTDIELVVYNDGSTHSKFVKPKPNKMGQPTLSL